MSQTSITKAIADVSQLYTDYERNIDYVQDILTAQPNLTSEAQKIKDYLSNLKLVITKLRNNNYTIQNLKVLLDYLYDDKFLLYTTKLPQGIGTDDMFHLQTSQPRFKNLIQAIKNEAEKLEAQKDATAQSTTPTAVSKTSVEDIQKLIDEYQTIVDSIWFFITENKELDTNFSNLTNIPQYDTTNLNTKDINEKIKLLQNHKNLVIKYKDLISKSHSKDTINETLNGLQKLIDIEQKLLNIAKSSSQDSKTNDVSPSSSSNSENSSKSTPTTTTEETKPEVPLTPEQWGIKFNAGKVFYMDLLPARQSTVPIQGGRDVPNAMPGLNYKLIPAVSKQQIPGFSPVYQNLGIKGMQVTIVGAFTGNDGANISSDTPDAKATSKFWNNANGNLTVSDNPGRVPTLGQATAYNSYTEFVQLCHEGKHMEVEINLFQVYQTSTATEIGEKVKLQASTGNPKFTGIVRSLDVYHQTKDRTWYTLIMDVTDFGMASKDPIDLNVKLQAAIEAAEKELKAAQDAQAAQAASSEQTQEKNNAIVEGANAEGSEEVKALKKVNQLIASIENITDPTIRVNQESCFNHMLTYLKYIQASDTYYFKDYITRKPPEGWTSWFTKTIGEIGRFSMNDITFRPKGDVLWVRARVGCTVAFITGLILSCQEEIHWKLNFNATDNKYITRYVRVANFTSTQGLRFPPNEDACEGTNFENETKDIIGWNVNTFIDFAGKFAGCATASALLGGATVATGGALLPVLIGVAGTCLFDLLAEGIQATQEYNRDDSDFIGNAVTSFFMYLLLGGIGKLGSFAFRKIGKGLGNVGKWKRGTTITPTPNINLLSGRSKPVTQTLVNQVDDILAKLRTLPNKQVLVGKTIEVQDAGVTLNIIVKRIDSTGNYVLGDNNILYRLDKITKVPEEVFKPPVIVPKSTTSTTSPLASKINNTINNSNFDNDLKTYLLSLPDNQKTIAYQALKQADKITNNNILEIKLKDGRTIIYDTKPNILSDGSISGTNINVSDIQSSILKPKPTPPKPPSTTPNTPKIDLDIDKISSKYIDNSGKAAIKNLNPNEKQKIVDLFEEVENNNLKNLEFTIGNSTTTFKAQSIQIDSNGNIVFKNSGNNDLLVNPIDLNYKKITPVPPSSTTTQPPQNPVPDNQSTTTQNPGGSQPPVQNPTIPPSLRLTGKALENYTKLLHFNLQQLSVGKYIKIELKDGRKLRVDWLDLRNEFVTVHHNPLFKKKVVVTNERYEDIVNIILPK